MNIETYTDGSATTVDKPGGWAFVVVINGIKYSESSGHVELATNNDMELEGAIKGLEYVKNLLSNELFLMTYSHEFATGKPHTITLVSDSQIVLGWVTGRYRFKQEKKMDKFKQLQLLVNLLNIKTRWVQGHSGDEHNERCDKLAKQARLGTASVEKSLTNTKQKGIICVWYKKVLKVIDLESNIIEDYDETVHGKRSSNLALQG